MVKLATKGWGSREREVGRQGRYGKRERGEREGGIERYGEREMGEQWPVWQTERYIEAEGRGGGREKEG